MDEITATRRPARPDLRVSDAERDAVVTELGEHFGQGRLDQAEFDERVNKALSARTGRDLGGLLADLPSARAESSTPQQGAQFPRLLVVVPLLAAAILIAAVTAGGRRPGGGAPPLFLLLRPLMLPVGLVRPHSPRRPTQRR